jgi:uncharacterized protein (TIGR04255 family)
MEIAISKSANRLHYKNPPIIEAVIAISVAPLPDSILEKFRIGADEMTALGYRQPEPLTEHQFEFRIEKGVPSTDSTQSPAGLKFLSENSLHAVQFNRHVFAFSRLGKYDCWEQFRDEARRTWAIYSGVSGDPQPIGLGVRYLNKLFIPADARAEDYVTASPSFPDSISPVISEMFMRIGVPIGEPPGKLIHTQTLLPPERDGFATLLLDNDFQFPVFGKTDSQVWEMLELVREIKDRCFVELTTNKMRETFNA